MNCKNCGNPLEKQEHFCGVCGGKVVTLRMTFKILFEDFSENVFGFDTRFFKTIKKTFLQPHLIITEYLDGVRKRYMNPFGFLAISAAISLLIYNYFADDLIRIQTSSVEVTTQLEEFERQANLDLSTIKDLPKKEQQKLKMEKEFAQAYLKFMDNMLKFSIQYFNLFMFFSLFIFAGLSKWTFWKPYNYGEHLIINAYLYGIITFLAIFFFFASLITKSNIFFYNFLLYPIYYLYTFKKLGNLTLWQTFLRFLRFLLGILILFIIFLIVGIVIGILFFARQGFA